ncbi:DNA-formamidopyrimidine glycosylase family protein, partial [Vibrio natriegens]
MPELPEVEVSRMGIAPHVTGQRVTDIVIRTPQLRWPVPEAIRQIVGQ